MPSQGNLAVSRDIFDYHNWKLGDGEECATGIVGKTGMMLNIHNAQDSLHNKELSSQRSVVPSLRNPG